MFKFESIMKTANLMSGIENMPVTLIAKPYRAFMTITIKLCAIFSFLVFVSFTPLIALFLTVLYVVFLYYNYIFIKYCARFGYKKIMMIIVLAAMYFICFVITVNLRHFFLFMSPFQNAS